jgi:hypothetical protein
MHFKKLNSGNNEQVLGAANVVPIATVINGRANIEANCKVVGPFERIRTNSLKRIYGESGPNGEEIFVNDTRDSRIRFGGFWTTNYDTNGTYVENSVSPNVNSFVEITFYGTALNMLSVGTSGDRNADIYVDGVLTGTRDSIASNVLGGRNFHGNVSFPIASNLALGWHTIRLESNGVAGGLRLFGFDVINADSQLSILSGSIFKDGYEHILQNNVNLPFIPASYTGTKGGRCLTYIDEKGEVAQAVNEVASAPSFLSSTSHGNEAVYRVIHFREFGREKTDDFSAITTSTVNRTFVLDDGTTGLVGNLIQQSGETINLANNTASFISITFEGTGLDLNLISGTVTCGDVYVDGVNVGTWNQNDTKICSDLPYGVHTVKIDNSLFGGVFGILDAFVVYRPKKPIISANFPVLADYCIVADYVEEATVSSTGASGLISQGVIRKAGVRELKYTGSGWLMSSLNPSDPYGKFPYTDNNGETCEFSFTGTGFDLWSRSGSSTVSFIIEIDKNDGNGYQAFTNVNFPSETASVNYRGVGGSFDAASALVTASSGFNGRLTGLSNLPFGHYNVRLTSLANASNFFEIQAIDVITPISTPAIYHGSQSLSDTRKSVNDSRFKTKALVNTTNSRVLESENVAQIVRLGVGYVNVYMLDGHVDQSYAVLVSGTSNSGVQESFKRFPSFAIFNVNSAGTFTDTVFLQGLTFDKTQEEDLFKD